MKAIVGSYLEIQAQLATDKIDGIKAPAAAIAARAEALGDGGAAMAKAARAIGESTDIKVAREAFGALSDAVIAAGQGRGLERSERREARVLPDGQAVVAPEGREDPQPLLRQHDARVRRVQEALIVRR